MNTRWLKGLAVCSVAAIAWAGLGWNAPCPAQVRIQFAADGDVELEGQVADAWIGVECAPVDEALRAQLDLKPDQGLLIVQLVPEMPAAKAGLKRFDVLTEANGQPLGNVPDLAAAVRKSQGGELKLSYLRAGKTEVVTVQPARRPARFRGPGAETMVVPERDRDAMLDWLKKFKPGEAPPMGMRFFHPGMVLPPGAARDMKLPDDMRVSITRQGDQPAKIVVKQGDKT